MFFCGWWNCWCGNVVGFFNENGGDVGVVDDGEDGDGVCKQIAS